MTDYRQAIAYLQRAPKPLLRWWAEELILNLYLEEHPEGVGVIEGIESPGDWDHKNLLLHEAILESVNMLIEDYPGHDWLQNDQASPK